jgi:hypothetical protein
MGDVARVLAGCNNRTLQSLMHDRLVLEACESIHVHWRNVRLEMSISDLIRLLDMSAMFERFLFGFQGQVVTIPLAAICPYDHTHVRVGEDDFDNGSEKDTAEHKAHIEWMAGQIAAGRTPRPIAVCPAWRGQFVRREDARPGNVWQRLDGFKRYMAHKALGQPTIECFYVASYRPGCQHGLPPFLEEGEDLPRALTKDTYVHISPDRLSLVDEDKQRYQTNEIELLRNGTIHVHVGDTRLEFTQPEFVAIAEMFQTASAALNESSTLEGETADQGAVRMARI